MRYLIWICFILTAACSFTQKVKTGLQAFEVKQYSIATQLFEKEYEESRNPAEKARLAFLAGESYRFINDHGSAGIWYHKAYKDGFGDEAMEKYASSLIHQERYEEALGAYNELLQANPENASYRSHIARANYARDTKRRPVEGYKIETAVFNSNAADYSPQPIGPGIVMFTSDRTSRQTNDTYLWTGRSFSDLYISNQNSAQVMEFDAAINSADNEGAAVISPDGNVLVLTKCFPNGTYDAWCQLMFSTRKGNGWSDPTPFPFMKEKVNYGHPAFAANGTTLFFSSDAPEGQGGHDLYYTQSDGAGGWSEPVNLGPGINTAGHEQYPTVYNDTLFFSSDHLLGLGGLDIFRTYLDSKNQWTPPHNMGAPINSGADDFGFVVDTFATLRGLEKSKGYFTSSRNGTSQNDDIYAYTFSTIVPEVVAQPADEDKVNVQPPPIKYQIYLALRVVEPEFEIKDDPNSKVVGRRILPNGPVVLSEGMTDQRFVTDELGQLLLKLEMNREYKITARYRDHLSNSYTINTAEIEFNPNNPITTVNHTLILDPIFKDKEIVIENIFYDYDQWFIRDDAKPALDALSTVMKNNPNIRIQLASHTDCRGTDEYNLDLSQKRAQAAIEYLISVGIPEKRLVAQGFGESKLAVTCECDSCSEENHQKNRRTTFKIID